VAEALSIASAICANAPLAVRASRSAIVGARDLASADRWALAERGLGQLTSSRDYQEGLRSFAEKRASEGEAR
jgi:enoyl-CoA hydratase